MGRLFWKIFLFVWLAQVSTTLGVVTLFHLEKHHEGNFRGPPPPDWDRGEHPPPPPPHDEYRPPGDMPPPPKDHIPVQPLGVGLVASLLFSALLARYLSSPIRSLRSAFSVAASGDLKVRASAANDRRRDELADLCRDFDHMVVRLQVLVDGQRRLLHDVSHELRSPLARLQAAIDIACRQPDKQAETFERIRKESSRIDGLVGELLTLSRLEAGTMQRHEEEIDLGELLADICEDARFEARRKDMFIELIERPGTTRGDGHLLHRAIENVIRNAVKYSPEGGTVRVSMTPDGGMMHICVDDSGPGVDESELESIFEPFHRGHRTRNSDGFGLGLAIARQIIAASAGSISGHNRPEGGFSVEIVLPVH